MFRIIVAAITLAWSGPALARSPNPAAALTAEIKAADAAGRQPPRLSDPAAAPRIRAAFDIADVDGVAGMNLGEALDICGARTEAMVTYDLFDLDSQGVSSSTPPAEAARITTALMTRNAATFQDEISLAMRFQLRCTAAMSAPAERFLGALPEADRTLVRRQGALQMRGGNARMLAGVIMTGADPGFSPTNRDLILNEAVLQADTLSAMIAPTDRDQVIAVIDAVSPRVGDAAVREKLASLRRAMSARDCGVVCAF